MAEKIKGKMHYAWFIFIGCCFVNSAASAATLSIVGVYLMPVSQALGVGPGDWMMWMALSSVISAIATSFWGQALQDKNINVVTSLAVILLAFSLFMFSFGNSMGWFWGWGILFGLGLPCIGTLAVPTLIGNWFGRKHRGKVLGIASAFIGVGAFVWAPLFTAIIQNFGWAVSYRLNALLIVVLLLPWTLFVFKFKPEDKGLKPYGYDPDFAAEEAHMMKLGVDRSFAVKTIPFWIVLFVILITSMGMGFNSNQVAIATEAMEGIMDVQAASTLGAAMISAAAAGNIVGKVTFGWIHDRLGLRTTFIIFVIAFFVALSLWVFAPIAAVLMVGAFLLGTHNALVSVGYPLLVRNLYGNKDYAKIFSNLMTVNGLMGGFSGTIISFAYQLLGSYHAALVGGMVLVTLLGVMIVAACSFIGKIPWPEVTDE